ncbi:hypothetical protein SISSUDRAFT_229281 [Sistotremastrum suecicum HHB10207 ss-3]|uniref:RRM domain-containing protein n=1 Tax=Sistotremastrum suecicum HHB10207 ss-3 TaxID=1314776 RepID=A0A166GFZ7_9AGAM|nr:hypothetical protein SISSUDRAFT_229281 [Sistotremastrum suecicum HHB10207 ss-3]
MSETVTKRLHISGLTPSLSVTDIQNRFSSFGKVTDVSGFAAVDGNGDPRKFGYLTLETSKDKLARCMMSMSGTMWKGAKLRIGEAKPDWNERLAKERENIAGGDETGKKKRKKLRGIDGVQAPDMTPVTLENASAHPGWHTTALSHLVRPMRMRPAHPLPPPSASTSAPIDGKKKEKVKEKKKKRDPPVKARRKLIDPRLWQPTHLKGPLLENTIVAYDTLPPQTTTFEAMEVDSDPPLVDLTPKKTKEKQKKEKAPAPPPSPPPIHNGASAVSTPPLSKPTASSAEPVRLASDIAAEIDAEKKKNLSMLSGLFGSNDKWDGKESVDDFKDLIERQKALESGEEEEEEDTQPEKVKKEQTPSSEEEESDDEDSDVEDDAVEQPVSAGTKNPPPAVSASSTRNQTVTLKDMFKPHEDEGGFTLMSNLDMELDPEMEEVFGVAPASAPLAPVDEEVLIEPTVVTHHYAEFKLDATQPFFFPILDPSRRGKDVHRDLLSRIKQRSEPFHRTNTSDEIRERWEKQRGDLTREWKKRHREAVKLRRRRAGGRADDDS